MSKSLFNQLFEINNADCMTNFPKLKDNLYINDLPGIHFEKVCRITNTTHSGFTARRWEIEWIYKDINPDLMYSSHRSWVYAITVNNRIVKFGETGNPLGIRKKGHYNDGQPKSGSTNRLGRYNKYDDYNGDSDQSIREYLYDDIQRGNYVEFYAYKCPVNYTELLIGEEVVKIKSTIHKDLEKKLIDYHVEVTGHRPELNSGRY